MVRRDIARLERRQRQMGVRGRGLSDTGKGQFEQGMEQYNDIDKVIDNWSADAKIDAGIDEAKQGE